MTPLEFRISGIVVEEGTERPLPGLLVRAYDKDRLYDDLLGTATTDESGRFEMHYAGEDFQELFQQQPDIYLSVWDASGQNEIVSTENSVRWDAGADEEFRIEVPAGKVPVPVVADAPIISKDEREAFQPYLLGGGDQQDSKVELKVSRTDLPLARVTLGDLRGLAAEVAGPEKFSPTVLVQPFEPAALTGIDPTTVRVFRWDEESRTLSPVWNSGINYTLGFTWSNITGPGVYVPLGLPRDRLVRELLREMARERIYRDGGLPERGKSLVRERLNLFTADRAEELEGVRQFLAAVELQTGANAYTEADLRVGRGGHPLPFPLPGGISPDEFQERLTQLETPATGLPEEALFFIPEMSFGRDIPWTVAAGSRPLWERISLSRLEELNVRGDLFDLVGRFLISPNWWMYHHDEEHGGRASGRSDITKTTAGSMVLRHTVPLPDGGSVVTIPAIVDGKIYVGTYRRYGASGNEGMYRIDLNTGAVEDHFPVPMRGSTYADGIGGSPAVVDGRVYFSHMPGEVYCVDAANFSHVYWRTDLREPQEDKRQPVRNPQADCFSSPLVVNGKVYIGCGEGEYGALGFVYCLDANNGRVIWLFCTCQLPAIDATGAVLLGVDVDNSPNVIPSSAAVSNPLPPWASGFSIGPDPLIRGASVWSSCAYDRPLNRIYVGTGNITGDNGLPDDKYGSGAIALDADTGAFRGFLGPAQATSYRPDDFDVDVPGAPTVFQRGSRRFVGIGSKNGTYFLLDPATMAIVRQRQLLPKDAVTGARISTVDPPAAGARENKWGIMGTAAVHTGFGILYVGLGGYSGIDDYRVTPFVRALDWETLDDAWSTRVDPVGGNQVSKYVTAQPPLYTNPGEAGLSSPAVVNDVVFVSTSTPSPPAATAKANLYALDAATGLCLWAAPTISTSGEYPYCLGPAIYGNNVVIGAGNRIYIYVLNRMPPWARIDVPVVDKWREWRWPWPPPPPDWLEELRREIAQAKKF